MSTVEQVKDAKNSQAAMLAIAAALDRIELRLTEVQTKADDLWEVWDPPDEEPEHRAESTVVSAEYNDEGEATTIVLKRPSEEKAAKRRNFAEQALQLHEQNGIKDRLSKDEALDAYALGGPMWLYLGNRSLFMEYAPEIRRMMVQDVDEDNHEDAELMARDVLKVWGSAADTKMISWEAINCSLPD